MCMCVCVWVALSLEICQSKEMELRLVSLYTLRFVPLSGFLYLYM